MTPKQLPKWATRLVAAVLVAAEYVIHHQDVVPPGYKWHGISPVGVASSLVAIFAAVGLSGPTLWPQLAAFLGNPGAPPNPPPKS